MSKTNAILTILLTMSLLTNIWLVGSRPKTVESIRTEYVEKRDTIVRHEVKYDTVYFKDIRYKTITYNDTVYILDSLSDYRYSHPDYDFRASAVRLDNFDITVHKTDTFTLERIHTVEKTNIIQKSKPFTVGIQAGAGYGIMNKKPDIYVGVGITYNIWK